MKNVLSDDLRTRRVAFEPMMDSDSEKQSFVLKRTRVKFFDEKSVERLRKRIIFAFEVMNNGVTK